MQLVVATLEGLRAELSSAFEQLVKVSPLSCGLSGGATALIYLGALRNARPDWTRVSLFSVDEVAVPLTDPESSAGLARQMLIDPLDTARPRMFPMHAAGPDLEEAALDYDRVLDRELGGEPLDLVIVGVGEDGHVGALFAGHPALHAQTRVVAVHDAPRAPRRRLTLSMPFLMSSRRIWVVAVGGRKRAIVQAVVGRTGGETPFHMLVRYAEDVTIFTDQAVSRG
jgi:6-phosphogluconolactonase